MATTGLGQLYGGRPYRAIIVHVLSGAFVFLSLRVFFLPMKPWNIVAPVSGLLIAWLLILGDAVRCAKKAPPNYQLKAYNRWYVYVLLAVLAGFEQDALKSFILARFEQAFKIPNASMSPTIMRGDHLLVDKRAYAEQAPQLGDLVVFRLPTNRSVLYVKRVIAGGGDVLTIKDKKVRINGQPLLEPYAEIDSTSVTVRDHFPPTASVLETHQVGVDAAWAQEMPNFIRDDGLHVPPEHYFLMGDNRDNSWDSRFWGFVPREDILGKASVVYYSWDAEARRVRWDRIGEILK